MPIRKPDLPKKIGAWTRPDSPRLIDSQNIYEYMNGAGELYVGYRFHSLEVFEYQGRGPEKILVEIYYMATPDDAFGLLSLDWGGEPVALTGSPATGPKTSSAVRPGALYGKGLLRLRAGRLYARVLASRETPSTKRAVLALGRAIARGRKVAPAPKLVKNLPQDIGPAWKLRPDRVSFFRSYLVLNNVFYVSHTNILELDHSAEAVMAVYESIGGQRHNRIQFLVVKYETRDRAAKAVKRFQDAYLPEHKGKVGPKTKATKFFKIEDGWLAYRLMDRYALIVFQSPDQDLARTLIEKAGSNLP
ncbi:MAG: hypothetical protein KJ621_06980 [Proteobacteria bacterium]|nr:hypothetical protein [Pseudomonadota bacterium]MBU1740018.1 hypothetical protein [Pseudomonadota bacterium]